MSIVYKQYVRLAELAKGTGADHALATLRFAIFTFSLVHSPASGLAGSRWWLQSHMQFWRFLTLHGMAAVGDVSAGVGNLPARIRID